MYGYVYLTTDLTNGKIYVGQHKSEVFDENYFGSGKVVKRKIQKYGKENFTCKILEECDSEESLNEREIFWIKELDALDKEVGYNIATGGAFGDSGYHLGMLGKHQSDKQKQAVRDYLKTYSWSDESRKRLSKSKMGNRNGSGNIGYIHIFKDQQEKKVKPEQLEQYLSNGWQKGHKPYSEKTILDKKSRYANSVYVNKDGVVKNVSKEVLEQYLQQGWVVGKGSYSEERKRKSSETQRGRICITDGKTNKYINKEEWSKYESMGYFKMCKQKYEKLYENTR